MRERERRERESDGPESIRILKNKRDLLTHKMLVATTHKRDLLKNKRDLLTHKRDGPESIRISLPLSPHANVCAGS